MEKLMVAHGCARKLSTSFINQLLARAAAPSTPRLKTRNATTIEQLESRWLFNTIITDTNPLTATPAQLIEALSRIKVAA